MKANVQLDSLQQLLVVRASLTRLKVRCRTKHATFAVQALRRRSSPQYGHTMLGGRATDRTGRRTQAAYDTHRRKCPGEDCFSNNVWNVERG